MRIDDRVEQEVAALGDFSRDELAERWATIYDCPPPKGVRRELLFRAAAWHVQAKRLGGMSSNTRRLLKAAMTDAERKLARRRGNVPELADTGASARTEYADGNAGRAASPSISPGTRLIRDWSGRSHVVDAIEGGFVYESKIYRSLSAIARKITGAHWSGPRFFGL